MMSREGFECRRHAYPSIAFTYASQSMAGNMLWTESFMKAFDQGVGVASAEDLAAPISASTVFEQIEPKLGL